MAYQTLEDQLRPRKWTHKKPRDRTTWAQPGKKEKVYSKKLTPLTLSILHALQQFPNHTTRQISTILNANKDSVATLIFQLRHRGLVTRPAGRYGSYVLTPLGTDTLRAAGLTTPPEALYKLVVGEPNNLDLKTTDDPTPAVPKPKRGRPPKPKPFKPAKVPKTRKHPEFSLEQQEAQRQRIAKAYANKKAKQARRATTTQTSEGIEISPIQYPKFNQPAPDRVWSIEELMRPEVKE